MSFANVKLIYLRELRDQTRDRRTLFTVLVLPLLLYPLMGMLVFHVQQFLKEHTSKVRIVGSAWLPENPPLIADGKIAAERAGGHEARLLELELVPTSGSSVDEIQQQAQRDIRLGLYDAVVFFPPHFANDLAAYRQSRDSESRSQPHDEEAGVDQKRNLPRPQIFFDTASDKSKVAMQRFDVVIRDWEKAVVQANLRERNVPAATTTPFVVETKDVAPQVRKRAALWSKILPFILMIWALTGAFYPAVDLCAGEKERGTLETLLSSPAARSEIVWGKLLTVMTFSMATSVLNLASMAATGTFIARQIQRLGGTQLPLDIGPPPLAAVFWLVLALVPISALFSALSLAIAAFARSSKEGHYYLMPLLMISLPLMMLSIFPGAELDLGFALIPLSGLLLLLRALIEGQYVEALRFSLPVVGVTAVCCLLAIRWAVDQFNNESVLFRESERFGLGIWFRHLVRDRQDLPTAGEAVLCGVLLLVLRFFFSLVVRSPQSWSDLASTTLIMLIGMIAAPACLMAIVLTRRPLKTLLLTQPAFASTLPAAALLAIALHPAVFYLGEAIRWLYPINPQAIAKLREVDAMFSAAPLWQALLVICLAPAICEELAFRGFILSGLRRMGHKWGAIIIASVFFGLAHGVLQQSLSACIIGIVIGYLAVKSGSLLPCILYHLVNNGLSVSIGRLTPEMVAGQPWLSLLLRSTEESGQFTYRWPVAALGLLLAAALLWWLKSLPYAHSAEEQLQEALDSQPTAFASGSAA
jgi:sodium transport system permease protein